MIGKKVRNLLIAAGLVAGVVAAVPTVSQASRYTGITPPSIAAEMTVDLPVTKATVKHSKVKKHTAAKHHTAKLAATKKHTSTLKKHTTTILYKHHHHKKAKTATKSKKHST
jgi:hypothetical protein